MNCPVSVLNRSRLFRVTFLFDLFQTLMNESRILNPSTMLFVKHTFFFFFFFLSSLSKTLYAFYFGYLIWKITLLCALSETYLNDSFQEEVCNIEVEFSYP